MRGLRWLGCVLWLLGGGCERPSAVSRTFPAAPPFPAQWVDVAEEAGLRFRHDHGGFGRKYFVEIMGPGCGFFDYNGDGWLDIYLLQGSLLPGHPPAPPPRNALYRNNGDGTFTDVTQEAGVGDTGYGMGLCVGDYNNDGLLDLYVTNWGPNALYRNNGDGTFTDVTQEAGVGDPGYSTSAAFLDYDQDGDLDLFVVNYVVYRIEDDVYCGAKAGPIGEKAYCIPSVYVGEPDRLYRNNGDGTFTDVTQEAGIHDESRGLGIALCDFDEDGDVDIYVTNDLDPNNLWRNNGDGTFTDVGLEAGIAYAYGGKAQAGMGTDWGDFDGDGDFDLIVCNFSQDYNTLYENLGGGLFEDATETYGLGRPLYPYLTFGVDFFDADLDGDLDLFFANGHVTDDISYFVGSVAFAQRNLLFANEGERFVDVSDRAGPGLQEVKVSRGAAFGDFDNDGDVDILIANWNDSPTLLRNDYRGGGHWILLELLGDDCPLPPIGAKVEIRANGRRWVEELRGATSYCSQNDLRLHFGLGSVERIEAMKVRWPCGRISQWKDLAVNAWYRLREGHPKAMLASG